MTDTSDALFRAAQRLDETPVALLNGGASDALRALEDAAPEMKAVAQSRSIDALAMNELWERAEGRLRDVPEDAVFDAAAEAASLLYTAAWVMGSESATTDGLREAL
jgi:hypothetical protein